MSKLATYVTVHDEHGEAHTFAPGTKVPDWAKKLITNPTVWAKKEDEESGEQSAPPATTPATQTPGTGDGSQEQGTDTGNGEPPRAGAGSSLKAWQDHATSLGITVPEEAKREDIFALVDAHTKGA